VAEEEKVEQVKEEEERGEEAEEEEPLSLSLCASQRLRRFFEALAVVADEEATIHVEEQRLWARVMDGSRCAMVCAYLTVEELTTTKGKFCVNVRNVVDAFRLFPNSLGKIRVEDGYMTIEGYGEDEIRLWLLDLATEELPEPKSDFEVEGTLALHDIYTCKRLGFDWAKLVAKKGNLYVYGGGSSKYASVKLKTGTAEGAATSTYSVSYLYDAVRIFGKHSHVRARFAEDKRLLLEEKSSRSGELTIRYWIAPRIIE